MDRYPKTYLLDHFSLAPDQQLLSRDGQPIHLPKKPFQVLLYLVEHRDRFVSRTELLDLFWEGKDVYDDALRKCIGAIRKALDEQPNKARFIETRWGIGYRYIGPLSEQVIAHEMAVTEIERTRGVKIVFESEEKELHDHNGARQAPVGFPPSVTALTLPSTQKRYAKISVLAVVFLVLSGGAVAVLISRRPASGEVRSAPIRSIAVLPLRNLTGDPADEYLSDGLTESLITHLSKLEGLKVISRGSAFTFKGKDVDPREAGRLLKVAAILEGSVRRSGEQTRVDVRLVSTTDGTVLWTGNTYDRPARDLLAVQDEIAQSVTAELKLELSGDGSRRFAKRYTDNPDAYQAYLKARYSLNKRTPEGITTATEHFRRAIEIDPNYALAYAGLAESYDKAYFYIELPPREVMARQREAAARALELDDSLADAHVAMATVLANGWDLPGAAKEEARAIEIDPGNVDAHHNYAYRLIDLCRPEQAVAEINRAQELDPLNIVMNIDVGEILFFARRHDEAISALLHALEMDPNRANAHGDLAGVYVEKGMYPEAVAEHIKEYTLKAESPQTIAALQEAFRLGGIRGFWRKRIEQLKSKGGYIEPLTLVDLYVNLGDKDQAFFWLEKAYQDRSPYMVGLKSSSRMDILRSDPRYDDLVRRVGL